MARPPKIIELHAPSRGYAKTPFFVGERPIDEPSCRLDVDDPLSAFAQYLMPRLKKANDEASNTANAFVYTERVRQVQAMIAKLYDDANSLQWACEKMRSAVKSWR